MSDELNNDPDYLATAITLNTDRLNALMERTREYRVMRDYESTVYFRAQVRDVSDRIRELRRRQRVTTSPVTHCGSHLIY